MLLALATSAACGDKIYVAANATATAGVDTTHHAPPIDTTKKVLITSISIVPSNIILPACGASTTQQIMVAFEPSNATNQAFIMRITAHGSASLSPTGLVSAITAGKDTVFATAVDDTTKKAQAPVTITACTPSVTTSVAVTPSTLNLFIGQIGSLTATVTVSSGAAPTPTWSATLGCVSLSATDNTTTVTATRVCRDSVVATANGEKGFSIITVSSGVNSIDYTPRGATIVLGSTLNLTAICTVSGVYACIPYWTSSDPSRVRVEGAPSVVVINGVSYPAGPTATIKAVDHGSADICVQAAVQDKILHQCYKMIVP